MPGLDLRVRVEGPDLVIVAPFDNATILFGEDGGPAYDLRWWTTDAGNDILFDQSASAVTFTDVDLILGTGAILNMDIFDVLGAAAGADSAATNEHIEIAFSTPIDTTGTNTHNALTIDLGIGNSTGGTNQIRGLQIDGIADDPQVITTAINVGTGWNYALDTVAPVVSTSNQWFDDFIGDILNPTWVLLNGTDAEATDPALVQGQFGLVNLSGGDSNASYAADASQLALGLHWSADQGDLVFECRLAIQTDLTSVLVFAGLSDSIAREEAASVSGTTFTTTITDGFMFVLDSAATAATEWHCVGVDAGTDATGSSNTGSGTAHTAGTFQVLRIEVDDGGEDARFYVDGTLVTTLTANAVTITALLSPTIGIRPREAAQHDVYVDYLYVASRRA